MGLNFVTVVLVDIEHRKMAHLPQNLNILTESLKL